MNINLPTTTSRTAESSFRRRPPLLKVYRAAAVTLVHLTRPSEVDHMGPEKVVGGGCTSFWGSFSGLSYGPVIVAKPGASRETCGVELPHTKKRSSKSGWLHSKCNLCNGKWEIWRVGWEEISWLIIWTRERVWEWEEFLLQAQQMKS